MRRRDFMTLVVGASAGAWPSAADAQQAAKIARIGYLASNLGNQGPLEAFRQGLRVNRLANLTPYRRPILTPLCAGFWR